MTTAQPGSSKAAGPVPVVHIITKLELGGAQQNTLYTLAHLDRRRFAPFLIAGDGGLLDQEARQLDGVPGTWIGSLIRETRPWRDLAALFALRDRLRQIRRTAGPIMVVHTHSSKAGILGRWAARMAGATVILHTFHGFGFHPGQPGWLRGLFIWLERMTATMTDGVIVVSQANRIDGQKLRLFDDGEAERDPRSRRPPAVLIRSGIDFSRYRQSESPPEGEAVHDRTRQRAEMRRAMAIPPESPVIVTVACLKAQKAPLDVVDVARRVIREVPNARFLLAGDGELRPQVEARIEAEGLTGKMLLLGWRRDVPELLGMADLFLLTSRWEGLPRVILEAMLVGLPVVATAVDGVTDVVQDGVTGFMAPVGHVDEMAHHIIRLLQQPETMRRMAEAARRLPQEFDIDAMVRRQEELYSTLLQMKGVTFGEGPTHRS